MKSLLLLGLIITLGYLTPVLAQTDASKQDVEVTNSYLNI